MKSYIGDQSGTVYLLGREIFRAGESVVHTVVGHPSILLKVFKKPQPAIQIKKLRLLAAWMPKLPHAAMPIEIVLDSETKEPVGYTMPFFEGCRPIGNFLYAKVRAKLGHSDDLHACILLCAGILKFVHAVHAADLVLADAANGNNLLINPCRGASGPVYGVDTNSFYVVVRGANGREVFPSCGMTTGYIPPEVVGTDFESSPRTTFSDMSSIAVLCWELLFSSHPYAVVTPPEENPPAVDDRVAAGMFPYQPRKPLPPGWSPAPLNRPLSVLPPPVLQLFFDTFTAKDPRDRPPVERWISEFEQWANNYAPTMLHKVVKAAVRQVPPLTPARKRVWHRRGAGVVAIGIAYFALTRFSPSGPEETTASSLLRTAAASEVRVPTLRLEERKKPPAAPAEAALQGIDERLFPRHFREAFVPREGPNDE